LHLYHFTVTFKSCDPHGVLKVMVNVPVCLLIEVTEKVSELSPASLFSSGKAATADQSLLLAVTLSGEMGMLALSMTFAEPPLLIVNSLSLR
jgi:hypothetical protein